MLRDVFKFCIRALVPLPKEGTEEFPISRSDTLDRSTLAELKETKLIKSVNVSEEFQRRVIVSLVHETRAENQVLRWSDTYTKENLREKVVTILGTVAVRNKWAEILYPYAQYLGLGAMFPYSELDYLEAVLDTVISMDSILRIRFVEFSGESIHDVVRTVCERLPEGSEIQFDKNSFTNAMFNQLNSDTVTVTYDDPNATQ